MFEALYFTIYMIGISNNGLIIVGLLLTAYYATIIVVL